MSTTLRRHAPTLLLILGLGLGSLACSGESNPGEKTKAEGQDSTQEEGEVTYYAEDFELPTHLGGKVRLSEALEKGPVILDFWATWCAPCKRAMPVYAELVDTFGEHGLQLLPVSLDNERAQSKIGPWFEERGFEFPSLLDPDREVAQQFNVLSLPTMFLLDSDGRLVTWHVGFRPDMREELEREIRGLVGLPVESAGS